MNSFFGGFLVWLVPFITSCFLIGPDGQMFVSNEAFRSIMLITASGTSGYCILNNVPKTFRKGVGMALIWLLINWTLDLVVLVPLLVVKNKTGNNTELTFKNYLSMIPIWFIRTGLTYIGIVSSCIIVGTSLEREKEVKNVMKQD